ncbi:MAG: hypothetical protein ACRDC4_00365 [Plesiomonas sp.]
MKRKYYYVTFDAGDGSAGTLWFKTKEDWLYWFELNESSENSTPTLDDGFLLVNGELDDMHILTKEEIDRRFQEEMCV